MTSATSQLQLRLAGGRFANGHLPLDFLHDLAALGEALNEIARAGYRARNMYRKSVPRGFMEYISPVIIAVKPGNSLSLAMQPALITREGYNRRLLPHTWDLHLQEAWNLAVAELAIDSNGHHPIPADSAITAVSRRKLRRFGANFKGGESATLYSTQGNAVEYNREKRRQYLADRFPNQRYSEITSVTGRIHEFNARQNSFMVTVTDGSIIQCEVPIDYRSVIMELLVDYDRRPNEVVIRGEVEFSAHSPVTIRGITDVTPLDSRDIDGQIATLHAVPAGWLDGGGESVNSPGLTWLHDAMLTKIDFDDATMPYLYPTEGGNVSAEWTIGNIVADLEIDLVTHQALWGQSDLTTHALYERQLNLNEEADWQWLSQTLRKMATNASA